MSESENINNSCYHLVEDLTKRVEKMENKLDGAYKEMDMVSAKIADIDKRTSINEVVLFRVEDAFTKVIGVIERVSNSINSIEKTMIGMQGEIRSNAEITQKIGKKVDDLDAKFDVSEEKAKIDFRLIWKDFIKSKITWIIGGILVFLEALNRVDWNSLFAKLFK